MKKLKLLMIFGLLCFTIFFSSCGRSGSNAFISPHLEDLDHMLYVMENNFALFDVAYWARGVDIHSIFDNVREAVVSNPHMSSNDFFFTLHHAFVPLVNIGHFHFIDASLYNYMVFGDGRNTHRFQFSREANLRLRAPHVLALYEQMHPAGFNFNILTEQEIRRLYSRDYGRLLIRGETELANNYINALIRNNTREIRHNYILLEDALADNVITRILEDGHIAYIAIDSFMNYPIPPDEERQIHNFYSEIADFDHLIIDLRYNGGGFISWFYRAVLEPNIDREFVMERFVFFPYGEYAMFYTGARRGGRTAGSRIIDRAHITEYHRPVSEILAVYDLPELNIIDMQRMNYGFRTLETVGPRAHYPNFCTEPTFQGKIWLLIGPDTGSAAQVSAWATRETGFATLVGEISGGNFGGEWTIITLPNSGIAFIMDLNYVTDNNGRPLEAGTVPDIFNHEGKDALETVLAIINTVE